MYYVLLYFENCNEKADYEKLITSNAVSRYLLLIDKKGYLKEALYKHAPGNYRGV